MVRTIPTEELGLWYVFLSLQGIAALFDLGFSPAVTRAAGYIWAGATETEDVRDRSHLSNRRNGA